MRVKASLVAWVLAGLALVALLAAATLLAPEGEPVGPARDVHIEASRYSFDPGNVTVKAGTRVVLHLTSTDVTHGLAIRGAGVYVEIPPGKETIVAFTAPGPGVYDIYCTVFCGSGHPEHRGKLIVEA